MSWSRHISRSISTPNKSSRDGRRVVEFIIHHNASMGGSYVLGLMQTGMKQVSANYQIMQNGEAVGVVPREERSWSVSNAAWDGSAITFEIANNSGAPGWTISDAAYATVARIIADDAAYFGIPVNRSTVRGHREGSAFGHGDSYSTACPGGIDLDRLVAEAVTGTAGLDSTRLEDLKEIKMAKLYRLDGAAPVYLANPDTGLFFWVQSEDVLKAIVGWGFAESADIKVLDQNGWDRLTSIIASMKPNAQTSDVNAIVKGVLAGLPDGNDPQKVGEAVVAIMAKNLGHS